jgi:hypothetical protein
LRILLPALTRLLLATLLPALPRLLLLLTWLRLTRAALLTTLLAALILIHMSSSVAGDPAQFNAPVGNSFSIGSKAAVRNFRYSAASAC